MEYFAWCVMAAAVGMGLGSFGTGIGQGVAISKAVEGVARNPGASGKIMTVMLVGLAMIVVLMLFATWNDFARLFVDQEDESAAAVEQQAGQ